MTELARDDIAARPADPRLRRWCFQRSLRETAQSMSAMIQRQLSTYGLTENQWDTLAAIADGKATCPSEIAAIVSVTSGSMTRTLDELERRGLVRRARTSEDRRVVTLGLTVAGSAQVATISPVIDQLYASGLDGLTDDDLTAIELAMRRLRKAQAKAASTTPASDVSQIRRGSVAAVAPDTPSALPENLRR